MPRRHPILAAISLALAIAFGVLQFTTFRRGHILSHGVGDSYSTYRGEFFLLTNRGCVLGGWRISMVEPQRWRASPIDPWPNSDQGRLGFCWSFYTYGGQSLYEGGPHI